MEKKKVLHLTLKKKWFDQILNKEKFVEHRDYKPYWHKRLEHKKYDYVHFVNGYGKDKPWMDVEIIKIEADFDWMWYNIHLGRILRTGNVSKV